MDSPDDKKVDISQFFGTAIDATVDIYRTTIAKEFNNTLTQFVTKLQKAYRDMPAVKNEINLGATIMKEISKKNPRFFVENFYRIASQHVSAPTLEAFDRDEFVCKIVPQIKMLNSLRITEFWEKTPDETKQSIWKYLQMLWKLSHDFNNSINKEELNATAMTMLSNPDFHTMMGKMLGN